MPTKYKTNKQFLGPFYFTNTESQTEQNLYIIEYVMVFLNNFLENSKKANYRERFILWKAKFLVFSHMDQKSTELVCEEQAYRSVIETCQRKWVLKLNDNCSTNLRGSSPNHSKILKKQRFLPIYWNVMVVLSISCYYVHIICMYFLWLRLCISTIKPF